MAPGYFITFEGGDGSGKTTQIRLLRPYVQAMGYTVVCTREPGGTPFAERIRGLLLTDNRHNVSAACELALFIASRLHHVQNVIKPALQRGEVVLCDRYMDSSVVYQGCAGALAMDRVIKSHEALMGDDLIIPDATICLDIDPSIGVLRSQGGSKNEDRFENKSLDFHRKVRYGFLKLAQTSPRYTVVDAHRDIHDVFDAVKQIWDKMHR